MEGYRRQRTQRHSRPLFVVGYEGSTEWNYVDSFIRHHNMTPRRAGNSENRPDVLLASTLRVVNSERRNNPGRPVIPIIVLDIEIMSDQNIAEMLDFVESARSQGVYVIVNRPKIEHWFLQHFQRAPENMSPTEVDNRLTHHLQINNLPDYTKPGSPAFYAALNQLSDRAIQHCSSSNHSSYELPCMCDLMRLVNDYRL